MEEEVMWKELERLEQKLEQGDINNWDLDLIIDLIEKTRDPYALSALASILKEVKGNWVEDTKIKLVIPKILKIAEKIETEDKHEEMMLRKALREMLNTKPLLKTDLLNLLHSKNKRVFLVVLRALPQHLHDLHDDRMIIVKTLINRHFSENNEIRKEITKALEELISLEQLPYLITMIPRAPDHYTKQELKSLTEKLVIKLMPLSDIEIIKRFTEGLQFL